MGAKLVKNTSTGVVNCTTDKDCYAANTTFNVSEATTAEQKSNRCCAKYVKVQDGIWCVSDFLYSEGWPKLEGTATKTCNYDIKDWWGGMRTK